MYNSLNNDSMQRIENIVNGFRTYPPYATYTINSYVHDWKMGVQALEVKKEGKLINLFLFYPDDAHSGKIGSIAIYGSQLQGHYNAIKQSMTIFGIPVSDISFDFGVEKFLDVYLEY